MLVGSIVIRKSNPAALATSAARLVCNPVKPLDKGPAIALAPIVTPTVARPSRAAKGEGKIR